MSNVQRFGATGDGTTDDTAAIRHAIRDGDGGQSIISALYYYIAQREFHMLHI